jgi:hypothetical protein
MIFSSSTENAGSAVVNLEVIHRIHSRYFYNWNKSIESQFLCRYGMAENRCLHMLHILHGSLTKSIFSDIMKSILIISLCLTLALAYPRKSVGCYVSMSKNYFVESKYVEKFVKFNWPFLTDRPNWANCHILVEFQPLTIFKDKLPKIIHHEVDYMLAGRYLVVLGRFFP